ncbi:MAG: hypothetical protein NTX17_05060 [Candidatus Eisenbacteria bacterium]|nr:hypothetical protein [Candidatus Eisenbacteria bacterium]
MKTSLKLVFSCLLAFLSLPAAVHESWAAFEGIFVDSKTAAMGDCWSASDYGFHFLAPVPPFATDLSASACYCAPYGLSELEQRNVLLNVPRRDNVLTFGIAERGGSLYKERILSACASRQPFSSTRIMLSLGLLSMSVDGYGEARFFALGAGLRSRPVRSLEACVGLGNLGSSSASDSYRGAVPSTFLFGLVLTPGKGVTAAGEVRKIPGKQSSFHLGAELASQSGIRIRCGLQTEPVELAIGFAIDIGRLSIESASSFHSALGRTDVVTLTFRRGERSYPSRDGAKDRRKGEAR